MSVMDNLLRLRRRQCEERRHYLAELEHLAGRLQADVRRLEAEIELAAAAGNRDATRPLIERRGKVERSVAAIEAQIDVASAALAAAEQDLRQHETTFSQRAGGARLADRLQLRRAKRTRAAASPRVGTDRSC
jgi:flagellar protein FliJ